MPKEFQNSYRPPLYESQAQAYLDSYLEQIRRLEEQTDSPLKSNKVYEQQVLALKICTIQNRLLGISDKGSEDVFKRLMQDNAQNTKKTYHNPLVDGLNIAAITIQVTAAVCSLSPVATAVGGNVANTASKIGFTPAVTYALGQSGQPTSTLGQAVSTIGTNIEKKQEGDRAGLGVEGKLVESNNQEYAAEARRKQELLTEAQRNIQKSIDQKTEAFRTMASSGG